MSLSVLILCILFDVTLGIVERYLGLRLVSSPFSGFVTRNCITLASVSGSTSPPQPVPFVKMICSPSKAEKSMSTSYRSAGAKLIDCVLTERGSSPPSEPIWINFPPLLSERENVLVLEALRMRKRYVRGSTSIYGHALPLTRMVFPQKNGTMEGSGSVSEGLAGPLG